jgi:hypothetical protein
MKIILSTLKKILFWSYERGSWQYDVMCVLILAFIFFSPNFLFQSRASAKPFVVRASEIGSIEENNPERAIQIFIERTGHVVKISRIEKAEDSSGEVTYVIYPK